MNHKQNNSKIINKLADMFLADLNRVILDFISAIELSYKKEDSSTSSPLIRWLDFTNRYIEPKKREILYSNRFPMELPKNIKDNLTNIIATIKSGGDINPHQSKGLIISNDTSSAAKQKRTDHMLADWGIHHLHISPPSTNNGYFSPRSDWLLFCIFNSRQVAFIDIRKHCQTDLFLDSSLLEIVEENWPEFMENFKCHNMSSLSNTPDSANEIKENRKNTLNSYIKIKNNYYSPPGGGITIASTSLKSSIHFTRINRLLTQLAEYIINNEYISTTQLESDIFSLHFEHGINGLCIIDNNKYILFNLPRTPPSDSTQWLVKLHNLILPAGAHEYLERVRAGKR